MLKSRFILFIALFTILATSCAKRGTISGGTKDTIPPMLLNSAPKNFSTNFKGDFIKINFNEYIKVKDINKQLIISPPMKYAPIIVPMGNASKFITIKIQDTLQANTTYSFNFGQSITDNNEGNPYSQFKYVISTGDHIDSLKIGGAIKDAYSKKPDNFVTVMLYEAGTFTDSTVYKQQPHYVTNTLDSLKTYTLENLKSGKYHLIALKDANNNSKFDPKEDKIGFLKDPINVPTDTLYKLELFKEKIAFKPQKPSQASSNKLIMGYEGNPKNTTITVQNGSETLPSKLTRLSGKDSLQVWIPKIKTDSLKITVANGAYSKSFVSKFKEMKVTDTLAVNQKQREFLNFNELFTVNVSTPIVKIDDSKISVFKKDSVKVAFSSRYNEFDQEIAFDFKKEEDEKYKIVLLPGALKDFYEKENDTLNFFIATKKLTDYGNLKLTLENVNRFPFIVELLNSKEEIITSQYSEKETVLNFEALEPNQYTLRIIYDDNKDKEWTTGSFLDKRQAEEVIYFPKELDVRANWDVDQVFTLSK
jgi:uncharacterized protein (DUF2141 family)